MEEKLTDTRTFSLAQSQHGVAFFRWRLSGSAILQKYMLFCSTNRICILRVRLRSDSRVMRASISEGCPACSRFELRPTLLQLLQYDIYLCLQETKVGIKLTSIDRCVICTCRRSDMAWFQPSSPHDQFMKLICDAGDHKCWGSRGTAALSCAIEIVYR